MVRRVVTSFTLLAVASSVAFGQIVLTHKPQLIISKGRISSFKPDGSFNRDLTERLDGRMRSGHNYPQMIISTRKTLASKYYQKLTGIAGREGVVMTMDEPTYCRNLFRDSGPEFLPGYFQKDDPLMVALDPSRPDGSTGVQVKAWLSKDNAFVNIAGRVEFDTVGNARCTNIHDKVYPGFRRFIVAAPAAMITDIQDIGYLVEIETTRIVKGSTYAPAPLAQIICANLAPLPAKWGGISHSGLSTFTQTSGMGYWTASDTGWGFNQILCGPDGRPILTNPITVPGTGPGYLPNPRPNGLWDTWNPGPTGPGAGNAPPIWKNGN